jgi:hypothetical protein
MENGIGSIRAKGVKLELLIDQDGRLSQSEGQAEFDEIWRLGLIRIVRVTERIIGVWFNPSMVGPVALGATPYEIARIDPTDILISTDPARHAWEPFRDQLDACKRIARLVGAAQGQTWPCGVCGRETHAGMCPAGDHATHLLA